MAMAAIFLIFYFLLLHHALAQTSDKFDDIICVVGGGVSGLTTALSLQRKGYRNVHLFERRFNIGGKALTYSRETVDGKEIGHVDIGPLFISDTIGTGPMTRYLNEFNLEKQEYSVKNHFYGFDLEREKNRVILLNPAFVPGLIAAAEKYKWIRLFYEKELGDGYLNLSPNSNLFLPTLQFLKVYFLDALIDAFTIVMTMEGYGDIADIPALYSLKYVDITKIPLLILPIRPLSVVKGGVHQLVHKMEDKIGEPFVHKNHSLQCIEKLQTGGQRLSFYNEDNNALVQQVDCQKTVLAFPPSFNKLDAMWFENMTEEESHVFKKIYHNKYFSSIVAQKLPQEDPDCCYFQARTYNFFGNEYGYPYVEGDGEVVAFLKQNYTGQTQLYTAYSWIKGHFDGYTPKEDLEKVKKSLDKVLSKLPLSRIDTSWRWIYFPHVLTEDLRAGFYKKFDKLQGKNGIYYATTLLSFELINSAMEVAEGLVNKHF